MMIKRYRARRLCCAVLYCIVSLLQRCGIRRVRSTVPYLDPSSNSCSSCKLGDQEKEDVQHWDWIRQKKVTPDVPK